MAEARHERLDVDELAASTAITPDTARMWIGELESSGLLLAGIEEEQWPILLPAGRQYLKAQGDVDQDELRFLPRTLSDLHARRAILHAGIVLVDEFRYQVLYGGMVEHARELVPPAFAPAVTAPLALDLFAAAVALMARLSAEEPAGCVAEEIIAVRLIEGAEVWLEMEVEHGHLDDDDASAATAELRGIFELFQDDDVLDLFAMSEPADAAVAGTSEHHRQLGVVDQRTEAWFRPFGGVAATGYLAEHRDRMIDPADPPPLPEAGFTVVEPQRDREVTVPDGAGTFRVCIRFWEDDLLQRDEFDQAPGTWMYYLAAATADEARATALERFPDAATSHPDVEDARLDRPDLARLSIDVQRVGLPQRMKAGAAFHIAGAVDVPREHLAELAAHLDATFEAAVVAHDAQSVFFAVTVNAESHEEAEADLEDAIHSFANAVGIDEASTTGSSSGAGARDVDELLTEIEEYRSRYRAA
ncbi:MAG: hypothetical protein QOI62_1479 [Solirubrobacteraceae bacterium]|nr:hypothetical protein [Solirubrobacteraceae bacterium]